ncbi:cobalamin B12-binding domain-containing protein [Streptomyces radiopugnans]|uniref:cobalamin B12-binding domain-containing protein n=1 Tax=Streptomyces radiopugnans TaxID=403935 RepID=UPI003F1C9AC8
MSPGAEPLGSRAESFWAALENADEHSAVAQVDEALDRGFAPEDVLLEVIAPAQRRVGVRWAENRLTVAQEHAATAVSDRAVTAVAAHPAARVPARLGRVTVACADGEWHTLPARLVAEVLRLRGWHVDFLGAHVSTRHLVSHLHSTGPDAVALSCSLPVRLPVAHTAVTACRAAGVPVLAGGAGFGPGGRYARLLGADAWAGSARGAAERLAAGIAPPSALPPTAEEALPHLADREHALVEEASRRLVDEVMAVLPERFPRSRECTGRQREYTVEDLHRVVEYLVAALYVDDPGLFEGFTVWTGRIMAARNLPVQALSAVLETMAGTFRELPRASAYIAAARAALGRELRSPSPESAPGRGNGSAG